MSYRIEYRFAAIKIDGSLVDGVDRYAVCIEGGDNNVYESSAGNARRSRSWDCCMLGTREEVIEEACYFSAGCETGCLKINGSDCTPESYITRISNLLGKATSVSFPTHDRPRINLEFLCDPDSTEDKLLIQAGLKRHTFKGSYDKGYLAQYYFKMDHNPDNLGSHTTDYATFFRLYPQLKGNRPGGWLFARCSGPLN